MVIQNEFLTLSFQKLNPLTVSIRGKKKSISHHKIPLPIIISKPLSSRNKSPTIRTIINLSKSTVPNFSTLHVRDKIFQFMKSISNEHLIIIIMRTHAIGPRLLHLLITITVTPMTSPVQSDTFWSKYQYIAGNVKLKPPHLKIMEIMTVTVPFTLISLGIMNGDGV